MWAAVNEVPCKPGFDQNADGGEDFYGGWMKNRKSAMLSCNDGFRPVSFLLEAMEEETD